MRELFEVDWAALFVPTESLVEIFIRGSVMYLMLFVFLRVILKREFGKISLTDMLIIVLIADAAQNGMAGEYQSITAGLLLVLTILFWSFLLDWLGFHWPFFERLLRPSPLLLINEGRILHDNLRKELVTEDELLSLLREHGVGDPDEVERVYMEADGRLAVIKKKGERAD